MDPEENRLLMRVAKLSEENNRILRKMQKAARWAILWGFIKIAIVVVPLVVGYIYLQPFFEQAIDNYNSIRDLLG
ncbi:MAG: hypothetical protein HYT68_01355 [Candidatus Zambryskibacteria bacterium]|nr:hypothetical protein [Candidatus Zambryskibacteria bacterium]